MKPYSIDLGKVDPIVLSMDGESGTSQEPDHGRSEIQQRMVRYHALLNIVAVEHSSSRFPRRNDYLPLLRIWDVRQLLSILHLYCRTVVVS